MMEGPGAESEEKREPASDIETAAVDSLKCLTQIGRLEKRTSADRFHRTADLLQRDQEERAVTSPSVCVATAAAST
jgi:hypothetical protein